MTTVHVDLRRPKRGTTDRDPVKGQLDVSLFRRQVEGGHFVLVTAFAQVLEDGQATLELTPTLAGTAWVIAERVRDGVTRFVAVPNSTTTVQYVDLVDVDPGTLGPPQSVPSWQSYADRITVLEAQVTALQAGSGPGSVIVESSSGGVLTLSGSGVTESNGVVALSGSNVTESNGVVTIG